MVIFARRDYISVRMSKLYVFKIIEYIHMCLIKHILRAILAHVRTFDSQTLLLS